MNRLNFKDRFWSKVIIGEVDECWNWTGAKSSGGYGRLSYNYKMIYAHRFSWLIYNGEIKDGLFVLHKCDNPSCVNPFHLFLGTREDNTKDMILKNRQAKGEEIYLAILTEENVKEIRKKFASGLSQTALSTMFCISRPTIYDVVKRITWKHI